jgi:site-specific DNA-methyltransferase (adenine-specific)
MFDAFNRVIRDNGCTAIFGSQPFTTDLICANRKYFKQELIWDKITGRQPFLCKIQHIKSHENILIFGKNKIKYNPIMRKSFLYIDKRNNQKIKTNHYKNIKRKNYCKSTRYPLSLIKYSNENFLGKHPTQKPVKLFQYLIRTYTDKNDIILDCFSGSGTTAAAAIETDRQFICFEKEQEYYEKSIKRIDPLLRQYKLFN